MPLDSKRAGCRERRERMDILVGILALIIGIAVCLAGLRLFLFMLPIVGFVAGFFIGAGFITAVFGDRFLATALGIIVGLVVGAVFSLFAYLYWYIGVIMAAGSAGALLGASVFGSLGVTSSWLLFILSVIVAAVFIVVAFLYALPVYIVIVATAFEGAALAIGGFLLLFGRMDRADFAVSNVWHRIDDHWFLWIIWAIGAAIGIGYQLTQMRQAILPEERWTRAPYSVSGD